jgi:PAS domain S-box-containing protein
MRLLIVTDDRFAADVMRSIAEDGEYVRVVGVASSAQEAEAIAAGVKPDAALVHSAVAGGGPACCRAIQAAAPRCGIVGYAPASTSASRALIRAGAIGLVGRDAPTAEVLEALRRASRGQASMSAQLMSRLIAEPDQLAGVSSDRPGMEGRHLEVLDSIPEAVIVVDPQGRIVFANAQTQEVFGYDIDELLGEEVEKLVPERLRKTHATQRFLWVHDLAPAGIEPGGYLIAQRADGSIFPALITLGPRRTEVGMFVTILLRDISSDEAFDLRIVEGPALRASGRTRVAGRTPGA